MRVVGAGHSFTPVVETDGLLLDLSGLDGVTGADAGAAAGRALPGTPIHGFYEPLWQRGWRCATRATSTPAHRRRGGHRHPRLRDGNTCLSGVVRGVRLVTAPTG